MHLSYLILAHRNMEQVSWQVDALRGSNVSFYLHFDRKMDISKIRNYKVFLQKNVSVVRAREDIKWGGYSMVAATIRLLKAAVRTSEPGYIILLSGQDFPIKSNEYIYEFYHEHYGAQYINFFPLPWKSWALNGGLDRLHYYWFIDQVGHEVSNSLYTSQKIIGRKRAYFNDFEPYGGSQWWSLTTECVRHILDFIRVNKIYDGYMKYSYIPDELYFQSIILNSHFKEYTVNDNLRYIDWNTGPEMPRILTSEDYRHLKESKCLYARKFDWNTDKEIISKMDYLTRI